MPDSDLPFAQAAAIAQEPQLLDLSEPRELTRQIILSHIEKQVADIDGSLRLGNAGFAPSVMLWN